ASPAYLARRGRPKTPDDLLDHDCIVWDEAHDFLNRWPFEVNGVIRHVHVRGRLVSDHAQALHQFAIMGLGVLRMTESYPRAYIQRGELVPILEREHCDEGIPAHALYLKANIAKPRVHVFVDFLTEKFAADSHKDMKPASSSARRRAKQVVG